MALWGGGGGGGGGSRGLAPFIFNFGAEWGLGI
jgi:hypothetical protein